MSSARSATSGIIAVMGVLGAPTCCLPIFPFVAAVRSAGASALLSTAGPYLMQITRHTGFTKKSVAAHFPAERGVRRAPSLIYTFCARM
jgi:hypothetical protein